MKDCYEILRKIWPDKNEVPDEVLLKKIDDINEIKRLYTKTGKINEIQSRTKQYLEDLKKLNAKQLRERADSIAKKAENKTQVAKFDNKAEGILSTIAGSNLLIPGAKNSAWATANQLHHKWKKMVFLGLEKEKAQGGVDLLKLAQGGTLDREIAAAVMSLGNSESPTIKITEEAWKIGNVIHSVYKEIHTAKRDGGISIGEIRGYLKQTHDGQKIAKAGFNKWLNDIFPHLDQERTFGDIDPMSPEAQERLKSIYDSIVEGKFGFVENAPTADNLVTVFMRSKLGDKLERSRSLHFKDANAFYEYNQQYGKKNIFNTVMSDINAASRQVGLVTKFGRDPEAAIEALIKQNGVSDSDAKHIRNVYRVVQGYSDMGGDSIKAKVGAGLRAMQELSKLGMATISSMGDWATSAAIHNSNFGQGYIGGMLKLLGGYLKSIPKESRNKWADRLGIFLDDMIGQYHAGATGAEGPGMIAQARHLFYNMNLLTGHTSASRLSVARQFAMDLADVSSKSFDQLSPRMKANLEMHGISKKEWMFLRAGVEDIEGRMAMTPEAVMEIPLEHFKEFIEIEYGKKKYKPTADKLRREIAGKLRMYLTESSELGVPQPSARTKAAIVGDTNLDMYEGQLRRMFTQFKSFPLTIHEVFSRVAHSNPDKFTQSTVDAIFKGKGDVQNMAGFILTSTMMGYLSYQLKEFIKTGEFNEEFDYKVFQKALVQGGAMGLYGDFIFGDYKNAYNSPAALKMAKNLAGPVLSETFDVVQLYYDAKQAYSDDPGRKPSKKQIDKQIITMMKRNTPFGNLFWTKYALDRMLWTEMYEAADPGYKIRTKQKKAKKKDWEFRGN